MEWREWLLWGWAAALGFTLAFCSEKAGAVDSGQYNNSPQWLRDWFKGVKSPSGVPCCDIADGHRTISEHRGTNFWVPVEGQWTEVPASAVVYGAGNPIGEAVVWYFKQNGRPVIRCFVPASEV